MRQVVAGEPTRAGNKALGITNTIYIHFAEKVGISYEQARIDAGVKNLTPYIRHIRAYISPYIKHI